MGGSVKTIRQYIAPDGNITIEEIGPVYLNGLKIEEAYQRVKNALSQVYASLNSDEPDTFIKVSLGNVRSIRVNVMGGSGDAGYLYLTFFGYFVSCFI